MYILHVLSEIRFFSIGINISSWDDKNEKNKMIPQQYMILQDLVYTLIEDTHKKEVLSFTSDSFSLRIDQCSGIFSSFRERLILRYILSRSAAATVSI